MDESDDIFYPAEIISHDLVEELIQKGSDSLYEKYIEQKYSKYSVKATLAVLYSTLDLFFFRREPGEPTTWPEAQEPDPSCVDTWVRHAIPIKKIRHIEKIEQPAVIMPDARSFASHSTRRTLGNRAGRASRRGEGRGPEVIDEPISAVQMEEALPPIDEEIESLRVFKERQIKRKKDEVERLKSIKEEEEAREKKMQKDQETLKNKAFTYDYSGKILLITPVKNENLPALNLTSRYSVPDPIIEIPIIPKKKNTEILPAKKNKPAPRSEQEWVKNQTAGQQVMFDQVKLSPGVTLVDGGRAKQGVEEPNELKTMSRKDYLKLNKTVLPSAGQVQSLERRSSVASSIDSVIKNTEKKPGFFEDFPEYEGLAEPVKSHLSSSMSPVRVNKSYGKIVRFGNTFEVNENSGPVEKFNSEILKNKNWGLNPPNKDPVIIERVPKKSSSKEMRYLYGDIIKKPKDQPFITPKELWETQGVLIKKPRDRPNIERVEKKSKMPPPPYGYTMVNALPEISGLGGSSHRSINESKH